MTLSAVSAIYRSENHRFVEAYMQWLEQAEKDLSSLRSSISILLQAEKSVLNSVQDGYVPNYIQAEKSTRKIQKAVAAHSLEKVSQELYAKIEHIDRHFEELKEKLCHAVAILTTKNPSMVSQLQADQQGVDLIWQAMRQAPETIAMFNYFSAKLTVTDVQYLLIDVLQKFTSNQA